MTTALVLVLPSNLHERSRCLSAAILGTVKKGRNYYRVKLLILGLWLSAYGWGATWYIRMDGGTREQCTGLTNAAYPGSGTAQDCAYAHPFWLVTSPTAWSVSANDTIIIGDGSYMIGWGAPNTYPVTGDSAIFGSVYVPRSREVVLPVIPNGVRILGEHWNDGCATKPEIWGTGGVYQIFNLGGSLSAGWAAPGAADADIECLEITDHAQCGYGMGASTTTARCESVTPYTDQPWAKNGIAGFYIRNFTIKNVWVHGMATSAIWIAPPDGFTAQNLLVDSNAGGLYWDPGSGDRDAKGTILVEDSKFLWGGCIEKYPNNPDPANHCMVIDAYVSAGDGIGADHSSGQFIFHRVEVAYNASDGIDLLYVDKAGGSIEIDRLWTHGNNGNALKLSSGSVSTVTNSIIQGNCKFLQNSGNPLSPNVSVCRAGGQPFVASLPGDTTIYAYNNVITEGDISSPMLLSCKSAASGAYRDCNSGTHFTLANNIVYGYFHNTAPYQLAGSPGATTANLVGWSHNLWYGLRTPCPYFTGETGAICGDPLLVNSTATESFDPHFRSASSPAINAGVPLPFVTTDYAGTPRPQGAAYDVGPFEVPAAVTGRSAPEKGTRGGVVK